MIYNHSQHSQSITIIYNHLQLFIINYNLNNLQDNLQSFTRRFTTIHNYIKDDLQSFTMNHNNLQDNLQSFTTAVNYNDLQFTTIHNIHNQLQDDLQPFTINYNHVQDHLQSFTYGYNNYWQQFTIAITIKYNHLQCYYKQLQ